MKKLLLITISLSIAYWGVLLAVEYAWTLPIPFLVIAYIWYEFLKCNCSPSVFKYKMVELGDRFGIKRSDGAMLSMGLGQVWYSNEVDKLEYSWTKDKEKVERILEQLNSN